MSRLLVVVACCLILPVFGSTSYLEHEELGTVHWNRSLNASLELAAKNDKPVLLLFQEIPGCSTCRNYGKHVLSDPMLVEIIEDQFIPCVIYNNKKGEDALVLKRYNEPSWNNPVVRIVDSKGKDIIKRHASEYTAGGLLSSMHMALTKRGIKVPEYMELYHNELKGNTSEQTAYFSMYCFWSGEGHLGACKGVVQTEPGFMNSREVVKVKYDPNVVSLEALRKHATSGSCTPMNESPGYQVDKDLQYYLKHSNYRYLPLTPMQRTKINSALALKKDPTPLLSPQQKRWVKEVKKGDKVLYDQSFKSSWTFKAASVKR